MAHVHPPEPAHDHVHVQGHEQESHDHAAHDHASHAGHHHGPVTYDRAFAIGIALNLAFVLAETLFGFRANSLALLADAGHNLGDVLGLALAWAGTALARREPTPRRTYGMRRFTILAALANAGVLLMSVGAIALEAIDRLRNPAPVVANTIVLVASIGIVINVGTAIGFMRGRASDVNIRGAFLHMMGDAAVSAGVVLAALMIRSTGLLWIDPLSSLIVAALIAWSSWGLARDSFNLALDAVPRNINPSAVRDALLALDGVTDVHDLHIWGVSTTDVALTAHLQRPCSCGEDSILAEANRMLKSRFGIGHATLQLEHGQAAFPCERTAPGVL